MQLFLMCRTMLSMSALTEHLDRLETWLRSNPDVPAWNTVLLVEAGQVTYGPIDQVPRTALLKVDTYEARFEALLAAGYCWINLSALGVHENHLLVCVELPRDTAVIPFGRTSVNLSGPPLRDGRPAWDASTRMQFV